MSTPSQPAPRVAFDLGRAQRRKTLAAYAAVLVVFFAIFGHGTLEWPLLLANAYGLIPASWPDTVYHLTNWIELDGPVLAWTAALAIAVILLWRRSTAGAVARAAAIAAAVVLAAPGVWAALNTTAIASNDLWWRIVQACGAFALIAAWSAARRGPSPAELGIERHPEHQPKAVLKAMRLSLIGFYTAEIGAAVLAVLLPLRVASNVGNGSGQNEPWWFWVIVFTLNAAIEETICTAWLYAQARRAGRPMWEVYIAAAALRAPFHLYMGIGGLAAAAFAMCNITAYHRTRRLLPLIIVHAAFDLAVNFGDQIVVGIPLAGLAFLAFLVVLVAPWPFQIRAAWRKRRRGAGPDYSHVDDQPSDIPGAAPAATASIASSPTSVTIPGQRDLSLAMTTNTDQPDGNG